VAHEGRPNEGFRQAGQFTIAADHPSLPGHFPGRPVVPGVVLLDHALALVVTASGNAASDWRAKFTAVVRPGEAIDVLARPARNGRVEFICQRGGETVLRGSVAIAP
jgi:3-hydroxymyristoyl/3-hydroxydecanoyl-(acyl carrier protein) dehydratase